MPVSDGGRGELLQHFLSLTAAERLMLLCGVRLPTPLRHGWLDHALVLGDLLDQGLQAPPRRPRETVRGVA
jgi:hypothetical protein